MYFKPSVDPINNIYIYILSSLSMYVVSLTTCHNAKQGKVSGQVSGQVSVKKTYMYDLVMLRTLVRTQTEPTIIISFTSGSQIII